MVFATIKDTFGISLEQPVRILKSADFLLSDMATDIQKLNSFLASCDFAIGLDPDQDQP